MLVSRGITFGGGLIFGILRHVTPKIDIFDLFLHVMDTLICSGVILPKEDKFDITYKCYRKLIQL